MKQAGPDARVGDAMTAPAPTVDCRATLEQAFRLMRENSATTVAVTDATGKLVGLVTSETLAEMMALMALPSRVGNGGLSAQLRVGFEA